MITLDIVRQHVPTKTYTHASTVLDWAFTYTSHRELEMTQPRISIQNRIINEIRMLSKHLVCDALETRLMITILQFRVPVIFYPLLIFFYEYRYRSGLGVLYCALRVLVLRLSRCPYIPRTIRRITIPSSWSLVCQRSPFSQHLSSVLPQRCLLKVFCISYLGSLSSFQCEDILLLYLVYIFFNNVTLYDFPSFEGNCTHVVDFLGICVIWRWILEAFPR